MNHLPGRVRCSTRRSGACRRTDWPRAQHIPYGGSAARLHGLDQRVGVGLGASIRPRCRYRGSPNRRAGARRSPTRSRRHGQRVHAKCSHAVHDSATHHQRTAAPSGHPARAGAAWASAACHRCLTLPRAPHGLCQGLSALPGGPGPGCARLPTCHPRNSASRAPCGRSRPGLACPPRRPEPRPRPHVSAGATDR